MRITLKSVTALTLSALFGMWVALATFSAIYERAPKNRTRVQKFESNRAENLTVRF